MEINIDKTKCIRCGHCAMVCPADVLQQANKDEDIVIEHTGSCIECGHCVDVCPKEAIEHESFPEGTVHEIKRDLLPTAESLMELIKSRRSNRTFTDKEIPAEVLNQIVEAAMYAPTAENSRKVEVKVIKDPQAPLKGDVATVTLQSVEDGVMGYFMGLVSKLTLPGINQIVKALIPATYARLPELLAMDKEHKEGKRPASVNARTILVFHAPKNYAFGYQDCNLAYQNASLMAEANGVSQVYLGFVQTALKMMGTKKAAKLLGIPSDHKAFAIMALGIPNFRYLRYTTRASKDISAG